MSRPILRVICLLNFLAPTPTPSSKPSIPSCVVRPGQLVYVQVLSKITIEGHSCQADASYWHDPDLSGDYWMTKRRPAIVLQILLNRKKHYVIKVVPIKLGPRTTGSSAMKLTNKGSATDACSIPGWPLDDAFCYVFPRSESFVSVPQVISFHFCKSLLSCLIYLSGNASTPPLENETKTRKIALE